jgi:hypothetical protein
MKNQLGYLISRLRYEPGTSKIWSMSAMDSVTSHHHKKNLELCKRIIYSLGVSYQLFSLCDCSDIWPQVHGSIWASAWKGPEVVPTIWQTPVHCVSLLQTLLQGAGTLTWHGLPGFWDLEYSKYFLKQAWSFWFELCNIHKIQSLCCVGELMLVWKISSPLQSF